MAEALATPSRPSIKAFLQTHKINQDIQAEKGMNIQYVAVV